MKERFAKPGNVYLGIPHRLDRAVSGVIVFTRNSKAAARMAEQFEQRTVRKIYLAVLEGVPDPPSAELTDWILKLPEQSRAEVVPSNSPGARECRLAYRVLATRDAESLVEIELHTGRMHQIRVQFASRGWPILGDAQYGSTRCPFGTDGQQCPSYEHRIALHAQSLTFQHPVRYDWLTVTAPLPDDWPFKRDDPSQGLG